MNIKNFDVILHSNLFAKAAVNFNTKLVTGLLLLHWVVHHFKYWFFLQLNYLNIAIFYMDGRKIKLQTCTVYQIKFNHAMFYFNVLKYFTEAFRLRTFLLEIVGAQQIFKIFFPATFLGFMFVAHGYVYVKLNRVFNS